MGLTDRQRCSLLSYPGVLMSRFLAILPFPFSLLFCLRHVYCSPHSNYLDTMSIGEELDVKGPVGEIEYLGHGHFKINDKPFHFDRINLIAGGSGLTPHWQLIHAILADESDRTQISLINSNKTFDDVLLYDELERLHGREEERSAKLRGGLSDNPDHGDEEGASRLKLWYTLTGDKEGVPKDWKYGTERLDEAMMRKHLFGLQPLENVKEAVNGRPQGDNETTTDSRTAGTIKTGTFLCGPPGLIKFGASPGLKVSYELRFFLLLFFCFVRRSSLVLLWFGGWNERQAGRRAHSNLTLM